jgi:acyl-CoA-dependent ceramide synthase
LVMHHINTLLLISLSYTCNFTRVGNAVFVCMDLPDAFLAVSIPRKKRYFYGIINPTL